MNDDDLSPSLEQVRSAYAEVAEQVTALYREAREAEAQLDAVLAGVPAIIWRWEPGVRCTYVNDAWSTVLGRDPSEALGAGWADSVHPEDADLFRERCLDAMDAGVAYAAEYRLRRGDGSYAVVNDQGRPMGEDLPGAFVGAALEVTGQRDTEARLRASNAMLSAVAEGMGVGLGVKDRSGRYLLVNEVMARILGASVEDVVGRTDEELGGAGWRGIVAEDEEIMATGEPLRAERIVQVGDSTRTYLAHKGPLRAADGSIDGIIIVSADITPEHLRRHRAELLETLAATLAGSRRSAEVTDAVLAQALDTMEAPHGALGLPNPDGRSLSLVRQRGFDPKAERWRSLDLEEASPPSESYRTGTALFFADAQELIAMFPELRDAIQPYEARAALPLRGREGPIGVLYVAFDDAKEFDPDTVDFFLRVADLVSRALERATLFDAAERAAAETQVLLRISADLSRAITMEDVRRVAATSARAAVDADACLVGLVDPEVGELRYGDDAYPSELTPHLPVSLDAGSSPAGDAVALGLSQEFGSSADILERYPDLGPLLERLPFASRLFVPIIGSSSPIGVLVASSREQGRFGPDEVHLLEAIGRQCGQSLERATFYRDAQDFAARAATLQVVTQQLAGVMSSDEAADAIVATGTGIMGARLAGLAILDRSTGALRATRWSGISEQMAQRWADLAVGAATTEDEAPPTPRPMFDTVAGLVARDPTLAAEMESFDPVSVALLPLTGAGIVLGVLGLGLAPGAERAAGDRALLEAFAERAGAALQRVRLLEDESRTRHELERALSRLSRLQAVTTSLSLAVDTNEVASVVLEATNEALRGVGGGVFLAEGNLLRRVAAIGVRADSPYADTDSFDVDRRMSICDAYRGGSVVWVPTREEWRRRYPEGAELFEGHARSVIAIPFVLEDRVLGSMAIVFDGEQTLTRAERRLARTIGEQAALALERARLYEAERRRGRRAERLRQVVADLAAAITIEDVATVLARSGAEVVGAQAGIVVLADGDEVRVSAAAGVHDDVFARIETTPIDAPFPGNDAIRTRRPTFLRTPEEIVERYPHLDPTGPHMSEAAWATLPLLVRGSAIGAFHLSYAERQPFDAEQLSELTSMVGEAALAMARARQFAQEREASLVLQESLLPRDTTPEWHGVEVVTRYWAGTEHLEVGGDWYDVIELADGRVGMSVGDVVGRGLRAAAAMGQLRSALRGLALDGRGPAQVLEGLDRFASATPGTELSTVVYGELDLASGTFRYASAGHPPPVVCIEGRTEVLDEGRSPLLAAGHTGPRPDAVRELTPGSVVVLYTDGLVERRGETFDEGVERLLDALSSTADADLERFSDAIARWLLQRPGRDDDVAFLCFRVATPGEAFSTTFQADPTALAGLRAGLEEWLGSHPFEPAEVEAVKLAVHEAAANSVEHGYRSRAPGPVSVHARFQGDELVATIRDQGSWRDEPVDPSRGRGLPLMRSLMDQVDVAHGAAGTTVTLRRVAPRHVPAAP